ARDEMHEQEDEHGDAEDGGQAGEEPAAQEASAHGPRSERSGLGRAELGGSADAIAERGHRLGASGAGAAAFVPVAAVAVVVAAALAPVALGRAWRAVAVGDGTGGVG